MSSLVSASDERLESASLPGIPGGMEGWAINVDPRRATLADGAEVLLARPRVHVDAVPGGSGRIEAAQTSAALGIGPDVIDIDQITGTVIQRFVAEPWQVGTLGRVTAYSSVPAIIRARNSFRQSHAQLPTRDLFADIRALVNATAGEGYQPSRDIQRLLALLDSFSDALSDGPSSRPSIGSADLSSVLVHPDGSILLLGGTWAGYSDPLADIGMLLSELAPSIADDRDVFERSWGSAHEGALARAHLFGILGDLRAALWSAVAALRDNSGMSDGHWGRHAYVTRRAIFSAFGSGRMPGWLSQAADGWEG